MLHARWSANACATRARWPHHARNAKDRPRSRQRGRSFVSIAADPGQSGSQGNISVPTSSQTVHKSSLGVSVDSQEPAGRDIHGFSLEGKIAVSEYKAWLAKSLAPPSSPTSPLPCSGAAPICGILRPPLWLPTHPKPGGGGSRRHEKVLQQRRAKWQDLQRRNAVGSLAADRSMKKMVRSGIVDSMRGQVWMELSGAARKQQECPALYQQLCQDDGVWSPQITAPALLIRSIRGPNALAPRYRCRAGALCAHMQSVVPEDTQNAQRRRLLVCWPARRGRKVSRRGG